MSFQGMYSGATTLKTAALMLATLPPIVVFLIFRNQIQDGLVDGALKR
jgi:ABC-type glycerol-3-phosphate transport system permease component